MKNLYCDYFDFVKGTTSTVENIDFDIDISQVYNWLENFADDFWGCNSINDIDLPDDRDELSIIDGNDEGYSVAASIKYADFISDNPDAKISRKYALLRKSTKDVHYSDEEKYFFFDTYEDALAELKENTHLYSKKILFFNISDRYGNEIVHIDDDFIF